VDSVLASAAMRRSRMLVLKPIPMLRNASTAPGEAAPAGPQLDGCRRLAHTTPASGALAECGEIQRRRRLRRSSAIRQLVACDNHDHRRWRGYRTRIPAVCVRSVSAGRWQEIAPREQLLEVVKTCFQKNMKRHKGFEDSLTSPVSRPCRSGIRS